MVDQVQCPTKWSDHLVHAVLHVGVQEVHQSTALSLYGLKRTAEFTLVWCLQVYIFPQYHRVSYRIMLGGETAASTHPS